MATASSANGEREDDGMSTFPVWLPASEPREFLDVMRGKKPHNDLTSQDCKDAALANARPMSRQRYSARVTGHDAPFGRANGVRGKVVTNAPVGIADPSR